MTLRDDLIAAKALIDTPEKWGKGDYEPRPGCYCALGAGDKITKSVMAYTAFRFALRGALPADWESDEDDWNGDVAQFNDHPSTTHADIMALFDRAIAACGDAS